MDNNDKIRYSRLEMLSGIGYDGLTKLKKGKVLIIGCGALGSLCAMYLAASGIGCLTIADFDTIDISNLQRQLFFDEKSLGMSKSQVLAQRIRDINSEIDIKELRCIINESKAKSLFQDFDIIVDGSDNPSTKKMTSSVCEALSVPYCIGGVREYSGQVMSWKPGHCGYTTIFGDIQECNGFTPCSLAGVLGPAAGMVASVQASEVIKHLTASGKMLLDSLLYFDLSKNIYTCFEF